MNRIWIEQCNAARSIEVEFGTHQAIEYLVGEKFINFLEAADDDKSLRAARFEMLLGLKEHEMHPRAQLFLIERMVGIVPHLTRAREAAQAARS